MEKKVAQSPSFYTAGLCAEKGAWGQGVGAGASPEPKTRLLSRFADL